MISVKARWWVSAAAAVAGALALGGCAVRARTQPIYVNGGYQTQPVYQAQPQYQQPVYQAQPQYQQQPQYAAPPPVYQQPQYQRACGQCVQGVAEVCNGCDDNCNGVVDEGCR